MPARISRKTLDEVRDRTDIVEVVSEFVDLHRAGSSMKGLCPFHREKTPSFFVSVEKGVYYCFGCGAGGDAITFLMKWKKLEYPEAVEELCARSGVEVRYEGGGKPDADSALFDLTRFAADLYHTQLFQKKNPASFYLRERGVLEETARELEIGYGGGGRSALTKAIRIKGLDENTAIQCGLLYRRKDGEVVDRFFGRLVFPVWTLSGKVAGFAGRVIGEGEPKYINSSESSIYRKKNLLYGLNLSRRYIREEGKVFVVEGYMDWIMMWQAGIRNVVATCGTAITTNQLRLLGKITGKVVLVFDGDHAGMRAAARAVEPAYEVGCSPMVFFPPDRLDPDDWIRREGKEKVKEELKAEKMLVEYIITEAAKKFDFRKPAGQLEYFDLVWKYLKRVKDPVERDIYVNLLSKELGVSADEIRKRFGGIKRDGAPEPVGGKLSPERSVKPEEALVGFLLKHPECAGKEEVIRAVSGFEDLELAAIASRIKGHLGETSEGIETSYIGKDTVVPRVSQAILVYEQLFPKEREENLATLLDYIELKRKEGEILSVTAAFREERDGTKREELLRRQMKLKREIEKIKNSL